MKKKEFTIDGMIEIPKEMTNEEFMDAFIEMIESKGWVFGGLVGREEE